MAKNRTPMIGVKSNESVDLASCFINTAISTANSPNNVENLIIGLIETAVVSLHGIMLKKW
jgi:hypothetical protein